MKKLTIITLINLFVLGTALASNPNAAVVSAKANNLNEVLSNIDYPLSAKQNAIEGTVLIQLNINEEGTVTSYEVIKTPDESLKEAVVKAIDKLQFVPAKDKNGKSVESSIKLPVIFELTID